MKNKNNSTETIQTLYDEILPTFLGLISDSSKIQNWEAFINHYLPKESLQYESEEAYLSEKNLSVDDVIKNSIEEVFADLDPQDSDDLVQLFKPLLIGYRIRELLENHNAVYVEIINFLTYIKNIQSLLSVYKKPRSDRRGTAHLNSSLKTLIKSQLKMLSERLEGSYFILQSSNEIEHTKLLIKYLEIYKCDQQRDFYEIINLLGVIVGINVNILGLNEQEIQALDQISGFYNGMKTQPYELVRSVMLYANTIFKECILPLGDKAENIENIARIFFNDIFVKARQGKKDKLPFTEKHISKNIVVKTVLHQTIIFTYDNPRRPNFLNKYIEVFLRDMEELNKNIKSGQLIKDDLSILGLKTFDFLQSLPSQEDD